MPNYRQTLCVVILLLSETIHLRYIIRPENEHFFAAHILCALYLWIVKLWWQVKWHLLFLRVTVRDKCYYASVHLKLLLQVYSIIMSLSCSYIYSSMVTNNLLLFLARHNIVNIYIIIIISCNAGRNTNYFVSRKIEFLWQNRGHLKWI